MKSWGYTYLKPGMSFDEPPIESRHHKIVVRWPSKVNLDPSAYAIWQSCAEELWGSRLLESVTGRWLLDSHARRLKGILKNQYSSEGFIQNKYNIRISKGILISPNLRKLNKISVRNSITLSSPSTTTLPAILKSHRSETWRHTGMRTEPPIPLETPPLSWAATIDEKWL